MWFSVVGAILALLITVAVYLNSDLLDEPSSWALVAGYASAVLVFAAPALRLLWVSIRSRPPTTTGELWYEGALVAILCLILGGFGSAPPFVRAFIEETHRTILRTHSPTAVEISHTPDELRSAVDTVIADSVAILTDEVSPLDDAVVVAGECVTSNLDKGTTFTAAVSVDSPLGEADFRARVAEQWSDMGYTVTSSATSTTGAGQASVEATGGVFTRMAYVAAEPGRMFLDIETICVVGGHPN